MTVAAWDLETCPLPEKALAPAQAERLRREQSYRLERAPDLSEAEATRLAQSLHPFLGWISAIAVAVWEDGTLYTPLVWTAASPESEPELLRTFWSRIETFPRSTRWVTFNGKRFDVPFLLARSTGHGLAPTRTDLTDTYPYNHRPHTDLMNLWRPVHYRLEELCAHLGVAASKNELDGAGVAAAVAEGRIGDVAAYCEADAVATLQCWKAARTLVP